MATRDELFFTEFDFLAIDVDDHIGMFSSAGFGPLPVAVLADPERELDALDTTELLPRITDTVGSFFGRPAPNGDYSSWLSWVQRGLFAYDWKGAYGPYTSVGVPAEPVRHAALTPIASRLGALPRLTVCFADCNVVDLAASGVAVDPAPDPRTTP